MKGGKIRCSLLEQTGLGRALLQEELPVGSHLLLRAGERSFLVDALEGGRSDGRRRQLRRLDRDLLQLGAAGKGIFADGLQSLAQGNLCQLNASLEGTCSNFLKLAHRRERG